MGSLIISAPGVSKQVNNLKISFSAGDDETNFKMLKETKELSSSILTAIFSRPLRHYHVPNDGKISKVIPVFRDGDRNSPLNYRSIRLTSISKDLEHINYSHIIKFLQLNNVIFTSLHSFRKGFFVRRNLLASSTIFIHKLILLSRQTRCFLTSPRPSIVFFTIVFY